MTKEDLLEKVKYRFGTKHMELFDEIIKSLMDEYAKQQAIAFNNWFMKLNVDDLGYYIVEGSDLVKQYITREQAYDKFIEQQQNK